MKELAGNPGKRKINKREPRPKDGAPKCPAWLPKLAKAEWQRIVKVLPAGLLTQADLAALVSYCIAVAELQLATEALEEGRTFTTEKGYVGQHPAVAQQRSAWAAVKQFAALFGLDPSSRGRMHLGGGGDEEADPLEDFIRGKPK